jgi:hypothetical protein
MSHLSDERMSDLSFLPFFSRFFSMLAPPCAPVKRQNRLETLMKTKLFPCHAHWNVIFLTYMQNRGMRPRLSGSCALLL